MRESVGQCAMALQISFAVFFLEWRAHGQPIAEESLRDPRSGETRVTTRARRPEVNDQPAYDAQRR